MGLKYTNWEENFFCEGSLFHFVNFLDFIFWQKCCHMFSQHEIRFVSYFWGNLFFASKWEFLNQFTIDDDPKIVELEFLDGRLFDFTALEAINELSLKYKNAGKHVTSLFQSHRLDVYY